MNRRIEARGEPATSRWEGNLRAGRDPIPGGDVRRVVLFLLGLVALFPACTPLPTPYEAPKEAELQVQRELAARLGPGDVFEVRVYGEKELSGTHRVAPDGSVNIPLIGTVEVADRTPEEVSALVAERLRDGFLRDPSVTVFVAEYNSKRVFVLGEVHKPGTFTFQENMSVVQAVTLAGGFNEFADQDATVVTRVVEGAEKRYIVPVQAITRGEHANFVLRPGDIVFIPKRIL